MAVREVALTVDVDDRVTRRLGDGRLGLAGLATSAGAAGGDGRGVGLVPDRGGVDPEAAGLEVGLVGELTEIGPTSE